MEEKGGKGVLEFTANKTEIVFLKTEKVTRKCMKWNRNSQKKKIIGWKNSWILGEFQGFEPKTQVFDDKDMIQREFQRKNDGNFMIDMTHFPWFTCIVRKKIHGPLAVCAKSNLGSRIKDWCEKKVKEIRVCESQRYC